MWSYDVPRDLQKLCQARLPLTVSNVIALGWDCWVRVLASWHWITTAAWRHSVSFGKKYLLWQCICTCNRKAFEQLQVASAVGDTLDLFAANPIAKQNRVFVNSTYTGPLSHLRPPLLSLFMLVSKLDTTHITPRLHVMQEEGNLEAAIECYEMALSIDVHYAKSSLLLGVLYRQRGGPHDLTLGQVSKWDCCMSCSQSMVHSFFVKQHMVV